MKKTFCCAALFAILLSGCNEDKVTSEPQQTTQSKTQAKSGLCDRATLANCTAEQKELFRMGGSKR